MTHWTILALFGGAIAGFLLASILAVGKLTDEVSAAFEAGIYIGRAAEAQQSRAQARGELRELREHLAAAQANGEDAWLIEGWQELIDKAEATPVEASTSTAHTGAYEKGSSITWKR